MVLGRIAPDLFFGGRLRLDVARARQALGPLPAAAIIEVANATMERALRVVSVERGRDPERFWLMAFGGAGPLHACELAERMHMRGVVVPRWPGLFSALGMVLADEVTEVSKSVLGRDIHAVFRELGPGQRFVDARYEGQSYELRVRWPVDRAGFDTAHRRRYGYVRSEGHLEIVNAIVRRVVSTSKPRWPRLPRGSGRPVPVRRGCYLRANLRWGDRLRGPAIIMEDNATTYLPPRWSARVDEIGTLWLER